MSDERYEIRGKVGQGGVGAVYRAFDRNLNREVAIKRVLTEEGFDPKNADDEATKSLLKEATALCSVQHPHIVTVYDAGVDEDGPYVVMELLGGRTLEEMVERGTMTWGDFREVAIQTQEALIAAQELDLVHRDIKPSNVMVTWLPSGKFQVKLLDFGLAKFSPKPSLQTIDHGDAVFGSIHFMAPEQFERVHLDKRTDMYSLGCVYYYALAGRYPFDGDTAPQVMASHLQNTFTPLKEIRPDVPDWACQWIEWHIARNMEDRPKDARESLERFLVFDQPVNSATAPVEVKAVPAAALRSNTVSATTGPVPLHAQPQSSTPPGTVKLVTGPPTASPAEAQPAAEQSTSPQPLTPPPGSKPSVHTSSQVLRAATGPTLLQSTAPPAQSTPAPPAQSTPVPPNQLAVPAAPASTTPFPAPPAPPMASAPASSPPPPAPPGAAASAPPSAPAPPAETQTHQLPMPEKDGMSTALKATIATLLTAAVLVTAVVLYQKIANNKDQEELQVIANLAADPSTEEIPLTKAKLNAILNHIGSPGFDKDKGTFYQALSLATLTEGSGLNREIAQFATKKNLSEEIRVRLFQVLNKRGADDVVTRLVTYAGETSESRAGEAALQAASKGITQFEVPELLKIISFGSDRSIRLAAEKALMRYAESQGRGPVTVLANNINQAYEAALDSEAKQSFLRLLGATGMKSAQPTINDALTGDDRTLKIAAFTALQNWPNDELFELHLEALNDESDKVLRAQVFETIINFLKKSEADDLANKWKAVSVSLRNDTEKRALITALASNYNDRWAIELVEIFREDANDDVSYLAERALERMNR